MMLHAEAPKLDRAYDIIDALISKSASVVNINWGYGGVNAKAFDDFTDEQLAARTLSRNPADILNAGHFLVPQTAEWDQQMTAVWEQIKLGF